ncbi:AT-rich interactive domain-containing protein 3C [Sarcoptes scabiei]|uniref:AT-rich interactive domain-containing protein 3C n=1 Tax=Sarcoptes scabiei TaxID=52283 RepID=A0A834REN4_SARSC|nr:AT-rich interactive domain-containing protein 3C [Sarcoptes scabiei]
MKSNQEDEDHIQESDYGSDNEVTIHKNVNKNNDNNTDNNQNSNRSLIKSNKANNVHNSTMESIENDHDDQNEEEEDEEDENGNDQTTTAAVVAAAAAAAAVAGSNPMNVLNQLNLEAIGRSLKTEDVADQANDLLARFKQHQQQSNHRHHNHHQNNHHHQSDYDEHDDLVDDVEMKPDERQQRDLMLMMQRQAAQMAAAAAAAGLPSAAHFANLAASVGNLSAFNLNSNAICQLNSALMNSNSSPSTGSSQSGQSSSSPAIQSLEAAKGYTYEEQFKQLYDLSDEPKRKSFLDDLFGFMQKRGTPINRIPIMAKQVLDLYELYQLVVSRGGLVEVINKKIWREITKGLNLPSSITSAAFTLRTQYMKYLYPYECEKEKLSSPDELQMAIDGNRREGRRSSYGQYPDLTGSPPPPSSMMTRNMFVNANNGLHSSPMSLVSRQMVNGHSSQGHSSDDDNESISPNPSYHHSSGNNQNEVLNLECNSRNDDAKQSSQERKTNYEDLFGVPPTKRFLNKENFMMNSSFPSTHLKISSKDGRTLDGQLTVSMEINGILYHGILFAQTNKQ